MNDMIIRSPIHYVAVGDSLTAGFGVPNGLGYAEVYRTLAEQALGVPVHLYNAGVNGDTSVDMLRRLRDDMALRDRVRDAHLISFTVGGNDLLGAAKQFYLDQDVAHLKQALQLTRSHIGLLIKEVKLLKHQSASGSYAIRVADLYNPIPFFPESVYWVQRFNRIYRRFEGADLLVADIYNPFLGNESRLLSHDLIHPNEQGHEIMAKQLHQLGYSPLI
jgi:lysophospholipase L1-like esterase